MIKRSLDLLMKSMTGLGQALLKLDGIGVDAFIIGFIIIGIIVIGSRGHGGIKEILLGSTSHYVLHKAPMPVLIIK